MDCLFVFFVVSSIFEGVVYVATVVNTIQNILIMLSVSTYIIKSCQEPAGLS